MKTKSTLNPTLFLAACFCLVSSTLFAQQTLRTNLFIVAADGSKTLMDGNMTIYDDVYCNCVNWEDAVKFTNPGVNWGLLRSGTTLSVERRKFIPDNDTAYIRMFNLKQHNFTIQVIGGNLDKAGRIGYVRDNFTNTTTPISLNDTTYVNFSVTSNSNTATSNRFSVIFEKKLPPAPLDFTAIQLVRTNGLTNLSFTVVNEKQISSYTIQQAGDAINFKDLKNLSPKNNGGTESYEEGVNIITKGEVFYRIKAIANDGNITFSSIAKLSGLGMNIFPNPITSRQLNLQIAVAKEGRYTVKAIGMIGNIIPLGSRHLTSMQNTQQFSLPFNMSTGIYQIQFTGPGNEVLLQSVILL